MVEARQISDWNHTSQLLAMMVNTAFSTKKRKIMQPYEFNPFYKKSPDRRRRMTAEETKSTLKAMVGIFED